MKFDKLLKKYGIPASMTAKIAGLIAFLYKHPTFMNLALKQIGESKEVSKVKIKKSDLKKLVEEVLLEEQQQLNELGKVMVKHKKTGNVYLVSKKYAKAHPEMYEKPSKEEKKAGKAKIKGRKTERKEKDKADKALEKDMKANYKAISTVKKAVGSNADKDSIAKSLAQFFKKEKRKVNQETFDMLVGEIEFSLSESVKRYKP